MECYNNVGAEFCVAQFNDSSKVKPVSEPGGEGLKGPVVTSRWQQREEMMIGVSCILKNAAGSA